VPACEWVAGAKAGEATASGFGGNGVTFDERADIDVCECQCTEFHTEDLYNLVFPPDMDVEGQLCMVFQCFLDDSKDQDQSKVFVSAGFFGTIEYWSDLRVAWSKCLKHYGLEYFKTSEYKMLREQFARFKTAAYPAPTGREKANEIRDSLLEIPRNLSGIKGIGCIIPVEDYAKVCARPEAKEFFETMPYRRALEGIFGEVCRAIETLPGKHAVAFVHDDGEDFDELRRYYNEYRAINQRHARIMSGFQPLDDKRHPPLQMADAIANFTQEKGIEWLQNGRQTLTSAWPFNVYRLGIWTEEYMLGLLKLELKRRGKPIPADLQSEKYD